jgi:hypothetical protein
MVISKKVSRIGELLPFLTISADNLFFPNQLAVYASSIPVLSFLS